MPARAFVDSDYAKEIDDDWILNKSKCPQGHLLILMKVQLHATSAEFASKCPQGHLLILMENICKLALAVLASKCPQGHLLILIGQKQR